MTSVSPDAAMGELLQMLSKEDDYEGQGSLCNKITCYNGRVLTTHGLPLDSL